MNSIKKKALIKMWIEVENRRQLLYFISLNPKREYYADEQKKYVIEKAKSIGVRATSHLLQVYRKCNLG